jgi:hypothetical protein
MDLPSLRSLAAEVWAEILARETLANAVEEAAEVEKESEQKMKEIAARVYAARQRDLPDDETPAWVAPTGPHDAYWPDFPVAHTQKTWESLIDANTAEPGKDSKAWKEQPSNQAAPAREHGQ